MRWGIRVVRFSFFTVHGEDPHAGELVRRSVRFHALGEVLFHVAEHHHDALTGAGLLNTREASIMAPRCPVPGALALRRELVHLGRERQLLRVALEGRTSRVIPPSTFAFL